MARTPKKGTRTYLYLDHKGIVSLVSQCEELREQGRAGMNAPLTGKELGLQLAVKSMGAIFGSENSKNYELYITTAGHPTKTASKKAEQFLNQVTDYLKEQKGLVTLEKIDEFLAIAETALPLFCMASLKFRLDTIFYLESSMARAMTAGDKDGIIALIIKNKFVILRADLEGALRHKSNWQKITLGAGLGKWCSVYLNEGGHPEFGKTSPLADLLRASIDGPITLSFFGHMIKAGTSLYIKPFAIWA